MLTSEDISNHTSTTAFSGDVEKFLNKEIQSEAILGPFTQIHSKQCHFSPLLLGLKEGDVGKSHLIYLTETQSPSVAIQGRAFLMAGNIV